MQAQIISHQGGYQSKALSAEEYLPVLASRVEMDDATAAKMEGILKQALDWSKVERCSRKLGIMPLLYKHLWHKEFIRYVPGKLELLLKDNYFQQSIRSLRIYGQLNRILDSMNQANIPVILLKGVSLAKSVYGDLALRPMGDIDILCREKDEKAVRAGLVKLGYSQDVLYSSSFHKALCPDPAFHLHPFCKPRATPVEVHLEILPRISRDSKNMEKIWQTAVPSELSGKKVYCLSPEFQLLYLSFHLCLHIRWRNIALYWFCDIHETIMRHRDQIDWEQFWATADSLGISAQIWSLFDLLRTHWNTAIPEKGTRYLYTDAHKLGLTAIIVNQLSSHHKSQQRLHYFVNVIKDARRIKGVWNRFYFLWRYPFPTRAYLIFRYHPKNSHTLYLHYIMHPCILFKRLLVSLFHIFN